MDAKDAYERGLRGRGIGGTLFSSNSPEEEAAYQRGQEAHARIDEEDRRATKREQERREHEEVFASDRTIEISSEHGDDDDEGDYQPTLYAPASPVLSVPQVPSLPMPYELGSRSDRLVQRWTVPEFINAWNHFSPEHAIIDLPRFHKCCEQRLEEKAQNGRPRYLLLNDFVEDPDSRYLQFHHVIAHYFNFFINQQQRLAWTINGHHKKLGQLMRDFVRLGANQ